MCILKYNQEAGASQDVGETDEANLKAEIRQTRLVKLLNRMAWKISGQATLVIKFNRQEARGEHETPKAESPEGRVGGQLKELKPIWRFRRWNQSGATTAAQQDLRTAAAHELLAVTEGSSCCSLRQGDA